MGTVSQTDPGMRPVRIVVGLSAGIGLLLVFMAGWRYKLFHESKDLVRLLAYSSWALIPGALCSIVLSIDAKDEKRDYWFVAFFAFAILAAVCRLVIWLMPHLSF